MHFASEIPLPDNLAGRDINKCLMKFRRLLEVEVGVDDTRRRNSRASRMLSFKESSVSRWI
jgi:hypothetical protein